MLICRNCGTDNLEGALFCDRCGVALSAVSVSTKQLGESDDDLAAGSAYLSEEHIVLLHITGYPDPIALQIEESIVLGRDSSEGASAINLEGYDALNQGVSRKHAMFKRQGQQLFIRDLGSTNHTFLNGNQLAEERDYALRDGDEIALGRLALKLFFK